MITVRFLDFATESGILRDLRMRVLYSRSPDLVAKSFYAGDEDAVHIGAFNESGILISIASLFQRDDGSLQLRGMATDTSAQGTGAGRQVVQFAEAHAKHNGSRRLWCNARKPAVGFL